MEHLFLALLLPEGGARDDGVLAVERSGELYRAKEHPSFVLFSDAPDKVAHLGEHGFVLGAFFHRFGAPVRLDAFDPAEAEMIAGSKGRHLVDRYWGNYLALVAAPDEQCVLRAPLGTLPCVYAAWRGGLVIASHARLLTQFGFAPSSPNWDALGRYLCFRDLPAPQTCLDGVVELLPGSALLVRQDEVRVEQCWSPWTFIDMFGEPVPPDLDERLRRAVHNCVGAMASGTDPIVATVSGGLDSSILLACLAKSRARVSALTISTLDPSGDERVYARALCESLDVQLEEAFLDLEDVDLGHSIASHAPRPAGRSHEQSFRRSVARAVSSRRAASVMSGNGGDNSFYNTASVRPILDRWLLEGMAGSVRTAFDIARLTGSNMVQVLQALGRLILGDGRRCSWKSTPLLLSEEILGSHPAETAQHPWFVPLDQSLPGKAGHINMLLRMQHHVEGYGPDQSFTVLNPLASQPIVELCLSIPSWHFCTGGRDRAIARRAFTRDLPDRILKRQGKAGPDSFILGLIEGRRAEIRERILDGALCRHRLIDVPAMEKLFASQAIGEPRYYMRLMELLEAEAWLASRAGVH